MAETEWQNDRDTPSIRRMRHTFYPVGHTTNETNPSTKATNGTVCLCTCAPHATYSTRKPAKNTNGGKKQTGERATITQTHATNQ